MKYNKLIRDKIPDQIIAKGEEVKFHIADEVEYWEKLKEKLAEEVAEFSNDPSAEELADILEVIDSIKEYMNFAEEMIEETKARKREAKGGFSKRIILDES